VQLGGLAVACIVVLLAACGPSTGGSPAATPTPVPASMESLLPYYGSYAMAGGDTVVIARLGWFFDLGDAAYRTIYAGGSPGRFSIGRRFLEPLPKFADLAFAGDQVTIYQGGTSWSGRRIASPRSDVTIPSAGATLAATITRPLSAGPHPGLVVVHGAEPGQRYFYDVWVGVYVGLGFEVLSYDKRGNGSSTGTYPGEFPTDAALKIYADDAAAALAFLARQPGVDGTHVGFHGGSQGGWTVPLAMARHGGAAFAVLVSAPATTVDQTDAWAAFSGGGTSMPVESNDQMLAEVRGTHSGYDPAPALRVLDVPALWLLGVNDRTVPTTVCVEILTAMHKPNFTIHLLPTGHALLVNATGLLADDDRSPGLAADLVPTLRSWLAGWLVRY